MYEDIEVQLHALSEIHDQGLKFKMFSGSQMDTRIQGSSIQFEKQGLPSGCWLSLDNYTCTSEPSQYKYKVHVSVSH